MGNTLVVSLVIASAFIAGAILVNYLAENISYEEPSEVLMEKLSIPADLFMDMNRDGVPEHFYLFSGKGNEIKVIYEGDTIDEFPPSFNKTCEVFLVKSEFPKIYIRFSDDETTHVIYWKPGEDLLKVEMKAEDLKWITPSKVKITSGGKRFTYSLLNESPYFTPESSETMEFLMKEYK